MNNWGIPNRGDAATVAAISEVIFGYCHCIDAYADEALLELFTPDGEWWQPGKEPMRGRSQIAEFLGARDRALHGRHVASNLVIEVEGPEQARVVSYYTVFKAGPGGAPTPVSMGEYRDIFRLDQGRWRIARRETHRVFRAG